MVNGFSVNHENNGLIVTIQFQFVTYMCFHKPIRFSIGKEKVIELILFLAFVS